MASRRGKFGKLKPIAGTKPFGEQFRSGGAAFCVHELEEKRLQGVSLVKPFGDSVVPSNRFRQK